MTAMKNITKILFILLVLYFIKPVEVFSQINVGVSFNIFFDALKPHGSWFHYGDYGYCWRPHHIRYDWRPYVDGHWIMTDYGWTWVSDYEWGWAPFHYGRWTYDNYYGWIWIPDYEWGPAWVEWRYSDDYIGWAPLPPLARFSMRIGSHYNDFGVRYHHWNFVHIHGFLDIRLSFLSSGHRHRIFHSTKNITNITIVNNRIYNHGPQVRNIERAGGRRVEQYRLISESDYRRDRNYRTEKNDIYVYRPETSRSSGSTRNNIETNSDRNRNQNISTERDKTITRPERNSSSQREEVNRTREENRSSNDRNINQRQNEDRNTRPERSYTPREENRSSYRESNRSNNERESRQRESVSRSSEKSERSQPESRQENRSRGIERNERGRPNR